MYEFHPSRASLFTMFIQYRKASDWWNDSYERNLICFDQYCKKIYPDIQGLTQEMVTDWLKQKPTETNASCRARTQVVITMIRYLQEHKLTDIVLPEQTIRSKNQHIPHAFSNDELLKFFHECDIQIRKAPTKQKAFSALTSSVLFRLLYSSGMRTLEARLLKTSDIDWSDGILNIKSTKGKQEHFVALHGDVQKMLSSYHKAAEKYLPDRVYFFTNGTDDSPITPDALWWRFRKIWSSISTAKAVAYDFRHHYAITNINSWIDSGYAFHDKFLYLSKSMGHSSLENTKYYYSLVPQMADTIYSCSNQSFDAMIPEVPEYEE